MPTTEVKKPREEIEEDQKEQKRIEKEFQKALKSLDTYREDPEFFEDLMSY